MNMRLTLCLVATACLLGLSGCATSPSYRAIEQVSVDGTSTVPWLLPPSANFGTSRQLADGTLLSWFFIDIPVGQSACPYAQFPKELPSPGDLQGEVIPTLRGTTLRLKFTGAFLEEPALRKAWVNWWSTAQANWPGKCLDIDPKVVEQKLVERSPKRFDAQLKMHYGFDDQTRSVILHPGTKVCAADVPYRELEGTARFSVGGETCSTPTSDGRGGIVFGPATVVLSRISSLDTKEPRVLAISSWAEIPYENMKGYQFLLRYPRNLPTGPDQLESAKDGDFPLLIGFNSNSGDGVLSRALQCMRGMRDNERQIGIFCGQKGVGKGFDTPSCGAPLSENSPLLNSAPVCFRFGERGVFATNITVQLNGYSLEVPLGTTLGGAIARVIPPPLNIEKITIRGFLELDESHAALRSVRLKRIFEGRPVSVDLSNAENSALDLPLLPGDQLSW